MPFWRSLIIDIGLYICKSRSVIGLGFLTVNKKTIVSIPDSRYCRPFFVFGNRIHGKASTKETHFHNSTKLCRISIRYIQDRRHFISIFSLKTSRRKINILNQIGIGKTQSFLLSRSDEKRAIYFYFVNINQILIIISTSNSILCTQLIIGIDSGQSFQNVFDTGIGSRHKPNVFGFKSNNPLNCFFIGRINDNFSHLLLIITHVHIKNKNFIWRQ
ncbi:hypothetical protein FEM08_19810 [Flavobacterium gilvum]|nr:hypothetical protein FEM08_19810 [Flavobacterium gilvum]